MAKRPVPLYDFKAFGAAIKAARNEYGESRKKVSDELYISPRYLANIENKGQQPSLQVFYDLVTRYHISVDQFFFPNSNAEKSTGRRQLDALLDGMSDKGIRIVTATAREITEVEKAEDYHRKSAHFSRNGRDGRIAVFGVMFRGDSQGKCGHRAAWKSPIVSRTGQTTPRRFVMFG